MVNFVRFFGPEPSGFYFRTPGAIATHYARQRVLNRSARSIVNVSQH